VENSRLSGLFIAIRWGIADGEPAYDVYFDSPAGKTIPDGIEHEDVAPIEVLVLILMG